MKKFAKKSRNLHKGVSSNFNNNRNHHYYTYILLKFHCRYSSHSDGLPFYLFEIGKKPPSRVFSWNEHISYSLYCCIVRCCNFLHIWRAASNAPHSDLKLKKSMCSTIVLKNQCFLKNFLHYKFWEKELFLPLRQSETS